MKFRVTMYVANHPGFDSKPSDPAGRTVIACFAGCVDEADAKKKARAVYDVETFKKIEKVSE